MAATQIDQRLVERLIFTALKTVETASLKVLLPGEEPPPEPAIIVAQLIGVEFDYPEQGAGDGGADSAIITALLSVTCPPEVTEADASQVQTASSTILAAMRKTSHTSGTHAVHIDAGRSRLGPADDELNALRTIVIELRGTATRSSGTSTE